MSVSPCACSSPAAWPASACRPRSHAPRVLALSLVAWCSSSCASHMPPSRVASRVRPGTSELDDLGLACQRRQRLDQKGLHRLADPEHHVRLLEGARLGGAQAVGVLRAGALDQQDRLADARHHARDQGVDRLDARHDVRRVGARGRERAAPSAITARPRVRSVIGSVSPAAGSKQCYSITFAAQAAITGGFEKGHR